MAEKLIDSGKHFYTVASEPTTSSAARLEMERENRCYYIELLQQHEQKAITNTAIFECPKCSESIDSGLGVILKNCLHSFCRKCLIKTIQNSGQLIVKCPSEAHECDSFLDSSEIRFILPEKMHEIFVEKSLQLALSGMDNLVYCVEENCTGWAINDAQACDFTCPVCDQNNCLKCKSLHFPGNCYWRKRKFYVNEEVQMENAQKLILVREKLGVPGYAREAHDDYSGFLDFHKSKVVENLEPFNCCICLMLIPQGLGIILKNCRHTFCKGCLVQTIMHNDNVVVKCPFTDQTHNCGNFIEDREIMYLLNAEQLDKHLAKSLKLAEMQLNNSVHCKEPNCNGWVIKEDSDIKKFICPVCDVVNCLRCKVVHDDVSCSMYKKHKATDVFTELKSTMKLRQMMESGQAMECPKCKMILTKISGCDGIVCSVCLTEICWITKGLRRCPNDCKCREGINSATPAAETVTK